MKKLFEEVTRLCGDPGFLHSVMKKYHYAEEEYSTIKNMAEQMLPSLRSRRGTVFFGCRHYFGKRN